MLVCREKNFAFQHVPNCGGTSVREMLTSLPGKWEEVGDTKHSALGEIVGAESFAIFANIRNPFDRIVSMYEKRRQQSQVKPFKNVDFKTFFYGHYLINLQVGYESVHKCLLVKGQLPYGITIIKLKEADSAWPRIVREHFQREAILPELNSTEHGESMAYFNNEMNNLVQQKEWWACEQYFG